MKQESKTPLVKPIFIDEFPQKSLVSHNLHNINLSGFHGLLTVHFNRKLDD